MSLKDGSKKMSKSELSDLSRINLTDNKDQIVNKIKKAKTDSLPMPKSLKEIDERVEAKNLIGIYASLTNSTLEKSIENFAGKNFSEFKDGVVKVQLQGSCSGCPSSTMTLKQGVQNLLCHYLPEVKEVVAI